MKSYRIPVLAGCLILFFSSLGWLSDVLVSSERESAQLAWRARLDGIAAMLVADIDEKMAGVLDREVQRGYFEYASPSVFENGEILPPQGGLTLAKPDYVKGYILMDFEGNIQTPDQDSNWILMYFNEKNKLESVENKLNLSVKYENLTKIKDFDSRLALRMMQGEKRGKNSSGEWDRLISPDKGFAFICEEGDLWALRQVSNGKKMFAQGIVFDAGRLKNFLIDGKKDVLPGLQLAIGGEAQGFALSSIPASLSYGKADGWAFVSDMGNYLKWSLILIWGIALSASAGLVWMIMAMTRLERRQSDFVSTVTHELRTPLTSMLLHSEMLEDGLVPEEKKPGYYETLTRECRRLERLIENILSYSRLQRGKSLERRDILTASELFDPLAERIRERLNRGGFNFSYAMSRQAGVQLVTTDILSVEQIIENLATNALKYAESPSPEVRLTVQMSQWELIIRFMDNGPGIPHKMRKKVFDPFRRNHSGKPGVGLGLALSRDMARSLGGDLVLEGGNEGASFKLTLPLGPV